MEIEPAVTNKKEETPSGQPLSTAVSNTNVAIAQNTGCATCGSNNSNAAPNYVYALGRIQPRFRSVGIEKEFSQALSRSNTKGLTDNQAFHAVLSDPQNRYLARQLCWILTIEGLDTYILQSRDSNDILLLINTLRPTPRPLDVDVVIGIRGAIAPPEYCNGLQVPVVSVNQLYSFDVDTLIKAIPKPEKITARDFTPAAEEMFMRIMQMADNAGTSDEHRALNYLAVRYHAIYEITAENFARNYSLSSVDVRQSRLSVTRKIVDVIFSYTDRHNDVMEKFFCRVDVSEEFPFLITKMQPYYDR